jgi:hypothetical protein
MTKKKALSWTEPKPAELTQAGLTQARAMYNDNLWHNLTMVQKLNAAELNSAQRPARWGRPQWLTVP